jgi:hypothetical protein
MLHSACHNKKIPTEIQKKAAIAATLQEPTHPQPCSIDTGITSNMPLPLPLLPSSSRPHSISSCQHGFSISDDEGRLQPYLLALQTLSKELTPLVLKNYLIPKIFWDIRTIFLITLFLLYWFRRNSSAIAVVTALTVLWFHRSRRFVLSWPIEDEHIACFIELLYTKHESVMDQHFVQLLISQATDSVIDAYTLNRWNNLIMVQLFVRLAIFLQLAIFFVDEHKHNTINCDSSTSTATLIPSTRDFRLKYSKAVAQIPNSREALLFLASNIPCPCLIHMRRRAHTSRPMCAATNCEQTLDDKTFECMGCHLVRYCSRTCYKVDWSKRHRELCLLMNDKDKTCACAGKNGRHRIKSRDFCFVIMHVLKRCDRCGYYRDILPDRKQLR